MRDGRAFAPCTSACHWHVKILIRGTTLAGQAAPSLDKYGWKPQELHRPAREPCAGLPILSVNEQTLGPAGIEQRRHLPAEAAFSCPSVSILETPRGLLWASIPPPVYLSVHSGTWHCQEMLGVKIDTLKILTKS